MAIVILGGVVLLVVACLVTYCCCFRGRRQRKDWFRQEDKTESRKAAAREERSRDSESYLRDGENEQLTAPARHKALQGVSVSTSLAEVSCHVLWTVNPSHPLSAPPPHTL